MKKIWQLGAIALILGMMAGCNLTSAPPSSLPRVSPQPRVQKPTTQPPIASAINNRNLLLGNPSNAAPSVASADNYLRRYSYRQLGFVATESLLDWKR